MGKKIWTDSRIELLKAFSENSELTKTDIVKKFKQLGLKTTVDAIDHAQRRYGITHSFMLSKTVSQKQANQLSEIKSIDWKISKSKKKAAKEKLFKTYIVSADYHIPYVDEASVRVVLEVTKDINPEGFILLGDYMDMEPVSHWLRNKKKTLENKRIQTDYVEGNKLLDEFDKILSKDCDKRYFYGNHERWYYDLIEEMPALEGLLDPKIELKLKERGYTVYDIINHIERIGRLCFVHGIYHNQNYVKAHIDKFQTNVMHADMHSPRFRCSESPARDIALVGYCLGCLCNLAPAYGKNRPNKWSHGFAVVYFYENGYFDVDLKRIVQGKCIFNGKIYDGNK